MEFNNNKLNNFFIVISGPTGVGKTSFVDILSAGLKNEVEVINADMGQFYTPLNIGTAKPDWKKDAVPQHLFDIVDKPINFTSHEYRQEVKKLLQEIWLKNKIPLIVGGSAFYIKSLFYYSDHSIKSVSKISQAKLDDISKKTNKSLWHELYGIDPARASKIHLNDRYRLERAIILWYETGILPSLQEPTFDPLGDFYMMFLTRGRDELYSRINKRVLEMFEEGWIQEVQCLDNSWNDFLIKKNLIGYPDIIEYLLRDLSLHQESCKLSKASKDINIGDSIVGDKSRNKKDLIQIIQKKTRNYAKRQLTFWRSFSEQVKRSLIKSSFMGKIEELNLTDLDIDKFVKKLSNEIKRAK